MVRRRTTTYDVIRRRNVVVLIEHVQSVGGIHTTRDDVRRETQKSRHARFLRSFVRTTSYDVARNVNAADTLHVFD